MNTHIWPSCPCPTGFGLRPTKPETAEYRQSISGPSWTLEWHFYFQIRSKTDTWRYLDNRRLDFIVDGKRAFGRTGEQVNHDGKVVSGGVVELMTVELTPGEMAQLARGNKVLGRLGWKEFKFRQQNQHQFAIVYRTIVCNVAAE